MNVNRRVLSLYVDALGELGSEKAIEVLESTARNNKLEEKRYEHLSQDIAEAIKKIKVQNKKGP